MPEEKQRYYATVKVTFEIEVPSGPWAEDATCAQMHRDVLRAASATASRITDVVLKQEKIWMKEIGTADPIIRLEKNKDKG